jgi:hypothetical protein
MTEISANRNTHCGLSLVTSGAPKPGAPKPGAPKPGAPKPGA